MFAAIMLTKFDTGCMPVVYFNRKILVRNRKILERCNKKDTRFFKTTKKL